MAQNDLVALRRARGTYKTRLTHFEAFIEKFRESGDPLEVLETRIEFVQNAWTGFDAIQARIEELDENDDDRLNVDERYCLLVGRARALVNSLRRPMQLVNQVNNQQVQNDNGIANGINAQAHERKVKLPIMSLPTFDGNPEQWLQFRDSFQGLIDTNTDLSDIQRMYYLRSALKGRAADVIHSLESSAANYALAWTLLKRRFEDKAAISNRHLQLLLDIPIMHKESGGLLRQLLDSMLRHLRALEQLGSNTWDAIIIHILAAKLDKETKREWRAHSKSLENVSVGTFTDFLEERCLILEPEGVKSDSSKSQVAAKADRKQLSQVKGSERSNVFTATSGKGQDVRKCAYCQEESHAIYLCAKFQALEVPKRHEVVKERRLCRNCLRGNHLAANCMSTHCKRCGGKHNSLLHSEEQTVATKPQTASNGGSEKGQGVVLTSVVGGYNWSPLRVILPTARIWLQNSRGTQIECRMLLDSGSQFNFISRDLCQRLKLSTQTQTCSVKGLGPSIELHESAGATIQSMHTAYAIKLRFLVVEQIIERLPSVLVTVDHLKFPSQLALADNTFNIPDKVDLLVGAGIFWDLLCIGQIRLGRNQPILQKTHLGWIVAGNVIASMKQTAAVSCIALDAVLHEQVERFWKLEEVEQPPSRSKNDELCEADFMKQYRRDASGRFTVSLPFRKGPQELGESHSGALKRFYKLERKLEVQPELKKQYIAFMDEYVKLGHMSMIPEGEHEPANVYYLPHHAVVTTVNDHMKLRVVFDASAKTQTGVSLNDILHAGPTIQPTLFAIVLRFRQHQIVVAADIIKMYRQVNLTAEQRDLQRIVWRSDSGQPVQEYRLNTVTYGVASAPFLAIRALQQVALENQRDHPVASEVILRDFYVDDLLTGCGDLEEMRAIMQEVTALLASAGFQLARWNSNEPSLIPPTQRDTTQGVNIGEEVKTLGLTWNAVRDTLQYQVQLRKIERRVTKRTVLSIMSQIFDPLGLVGPSTIKAKLILQRMWQLKLDWDEAVPVSLHTEWTEYVNTIASINEICIPRVLVCKESVRIELHGFSDASQEAYGACMYLQSVDQHGHSNVRLVCAKSRVAPLKTVSLPRLELCGAVLLVKLMRQVIETLTISIQSHHLWCDSTIVLAWIRDEPYLRKTFVANRITEIQQLSERNMWHHVRSEDNPADLLTRGVSPSQLKHSQLWWRGPEWLHNSEEYITQETPGITGELPESRQNILNCMMVAEANNIFRRFSSLSRLTRVVAYCLRWREPRRNPAAASIRTPSVKELDRAMKVIIQAVQAHCFPQEIATLKSKGHVKQNSRLLTLHPFLDADGIIRVGGRLANASIAYTRQHPVVLPSSSHVTRLIIRDTHIKNLHLGAQALLATLQEAFWILSARSAIRQVLHKCVICFRARPRQTHHVMGELPSPRVSTTRAFTNVGVDYGGPFNLKLSRNKTCKSYVCVFVCLATKALHIELVPDLSTAAFLNALKRFIARRGLCSHIYSDNASNFKGAKNELQVLYDLFQQSSHKMVIERYCSENAIQWHFIPPYSPHMGGIWEAGIKSVKTHLRKILGEALLTFEEMYTVLTQIEAVLNSRPLTPVSNDPGDFRALTPGHFLIGAPLNAIPQCSLLDRPINRLSRFQYLTRLVQAFWNRWSTEYLSNLQQRFKWNREDTTTPIKKGSMVLLREEHTPSMQWPLGRIIECHPGRDNKCRVVSVKTAKGVVTRALTKICILPIDIE